MTNIEVKVTGAQAVAQVSGLLTGGMTGVRVRFTFDEAWQGLRKTVVFRAGDKALAVPDVLVATTVPREITQKVGCTLHVGVYGISEEEDLAIPTVWAQAGTILPGTDPDVDPAGTPTLPLWLQAIDTAQQAIDMAQGVRDEADMGLLDGYSPVRGEDYWTEEDIAQIKGYVDEAILGGKW